MATPAVRESSVLVSLRELRAIEDDRTAEERAAAAREALAQRQHERDLAEAHRAAEEARQVAIARAERAAAEAAAAAAREDELRLREAEIRARAAAAAAVEAQRIEHEAELRRLALERTRPRSLYAIVGLCVAAIAGLAVLLVHRESDLAERERQLQDVAHQHAATQVALDQATRDRDALNQAMTEMREHAARLAAAAAAAPPAVSTSVITPNPATRERLKTGHFGRSGTGCIYCGADALGKFAA